VLERMRASRGRVRLIEHAALLYLPSMTERFPEKMAAWRLLLHGSASRESCGSRPVKLPPRRCHPCIPLPCAMTSSAPGGRDSTPGAVQRLTGVPPRSQGRLLAEEIPFGMSDLQLYRRVEENSGIITPLYGLNTILASHPGAQAGQLVFGRLGSRLEGPASLPSPILRRAIRRKRW
jgi:hypothetical protein